MDFQIDSAENFTKKMEKTSLSINESVMEVLELKDIDLSDPPTEKEIEFAKNNRPAWTRKWY